MEGPRLYLGRPSIPFLPEELSLMSVDRLPPAVKITWDRTRTVNYNGDETMMNTYECTSCKETYKMEINTHYFCPYCGTRYKYQEDISI